MKKVLFLTYVYPYGYFNASASCSTRIMRKLVEDNDIEVHCVSYEQYSDGGQPYEKIPGVLLHPIRLKERKKYTKTMQHLRILLKIPQYPINSFHRIWTHYKVVSEICKKEKFDQVIAQCYPEESYIVGALLRRNGYIDNLTVIFWDNVYGKNPARVIPKWYATRRQKFLESFVARHSDLLISLYPIKFFHDEHGDIPEAIGKRKYLGIPSVIQPEPIVKTKYLSVIKEGKVNILYSGIILNPGFVHKLISSLNFSFRSESLNLIFFSRGMSESEFDELRANFKGTIQSPGYIPIKDLLSVYHKADVFISFPGELRSIRSKCYEYMSYGHPMIVLYNNPEDVNVKTFSKYPLCLTLSMEEDKKLFAKTFDKFIDTSLGNIVPFNIVESMFATDTPKEYADLIKKQMKDSLL